MANIQNNPSFPPAFGEYLTNNGFSVSQNDYCLTYKSEDFTVIFGFQHYKMTVIKNNDEFSKLFTLHPIQELDYYGFDNLDIYSFMQLLNITGAVKISNILQNSRKLGMQVFTETAFLLEGYYTKNLPI